MWLRSPLPRVARAPDGPDSPALGLACVTGAEPRPGRASRRIETLSEAAFAAWLDARLPARQGGALIILRLRHAGEAALQGLAEASVRAVRPDDRVGRAGPASLAIWLEGVPAALAARRSERLRLSLHRLGVQGFDLATLPVCPTDVRNSAALLAAAAARIGTSERVQP
ncbi:MAG: hypothetical protein ACK4PG_00220 [Acetobacteraceae bacterium]